MIRYLSIEEFGQWYASARILESRFIGKDWAEVYSGEVLFLAFGNSQIDEVWLVGSLRKFGLRLAITPSGLPSVGFATAKESADRATRIAEGLQFLRGRGFHWIHLDFPPEWCTSAPECEGFNRFSKRTYRLQTLGLIEPVESGFSSSARNMIQKARRVGLSVSLSSDNTASMALIRSFLSSLNLNHLIHRYTRMQEILPTESLVLINVTKGERVLWTGLFLKEGKGMYYLAGARNRDYPENSANAFGIHFAISHAHHEGLAFFDFEGSVIPAVEKFFQSFNPVRMDYFAYEYQNPLLRWLRTWKHMLSFRKS
ncbi:MAG: hypothetical protein ACK500_03045 [Flavobacteriales bacterium]